MSQSHRRFSLDTDQRVLLIVFGGLVVVGLFAFASNPPRSSDVASGSSHSAAADGGEALYRWLDRLGYQPQRIEYGPFAIPDTADLLFVLDPQSDFSNVNRDTVLDWVRAGHTLVLAEGGTTASKLLAGLDFALDNGAARPVLTTSQPLWQRPPVRRVQADSEYVLDAQKRKDGYTVYLAQGSSASSRQPIFVGLELGEGRVYLCSAPALFANANLGKEDNAKLILNLLEAVEPGASVAFDEYHHGYVQAESIGAAIFGTRWGWAVLYGALVLAAYLVISGRRFGRIVPLVPPGTRRSSGEYVAAVGGMFRRAGRRRWVVDHYRRGLRSDLGKAFGLDPDSPVAALTDEIARSSPRPIDRAALLALLSELDRASSLGDHAYSDADLLALSKRLAAVRQMVLGR